MAINRPLPVPDARATSKIAGAMQQIDRLITLVNAPVSVTSQRPVPAELHNWDLVAPTMLYSATSCLVSLRWLAEAPAPGRDEDALVLLRRLYEHAVLFAWIAIDPAVNAPRWIADDYYHRIQADKDLSLIGVEGLTPQRRAEYQAFINQHRRRPNTADCADHADRYWSTRIDGHGTFPRAAGEAQTGRYSLRKMYAAVYRPASANAHPTAFSLRDFVWPTGAPDRYSIGFNPAHAIDRSPYTMAPLVFACMLLVAEQVLGRLCGDDVRAAFSE